MLEFHSVVNGHRICLICRLPPRIKSLQVLEKWHVAFYGTQIGKIRRILDVGDLPMPGIQKINLRILCSAFSYPELTFRKKTKGPGLTARLLIIIG